MARLCLLIAALTSAPVLAKAQMSCTNVFERVSAPGEYAALIDHYRNGDYELAVNALGAIDESTLRAFEKRVSRLSADARMEPCLKAAALAHAEASVRAYSNQKWTQAEQQLRAGRRLLERVPADTTVFHRNWLLLIALLHQDLIFNVNAARTRADTERHFEEALRAYPRDAEILLAAGTLYEWAGSLRYGTSDDLEDAQELYETAIEAEPEMAEAHLRLGNVLEKRGKFRNAREPLEAALSLSVNALIIYRAHMSLGRLDQADGFLDEAIGHYETAASLIPQWQVAYLAWSHALHVSGRRVAAQRTLERGMALEPTDEMLFGWWSYETGLVDRANDLVYEMRAEVAP